MTTIYHRRSIRFVIHLFFSPFFFPSIVAFSRLLFSLLIFVVCIIQHPDFYVQLRFVNRHLYMNRYVDQLLYRPQVYMVDIFSPISSSFFFSFWLPSIFDSFLTYTYGLDCKFFFQLFPSFFRIKMIAPYYPPRAHDTLFLLSTMRKHPGNL